MANAFVRDAALQAAPTSKRGILERVFARMFEGLVYAQIWEDPEVDMAALELGPTSRLMTMTLARMITIATITEIGSV